MGYLVIGLLAGLAATPHCLGMCGAFPLHLARPGDPSRPLPRQLCYLAGKGLTYAFLGMVAGSAGHALVHGPHFSLSQNLLAYVSGALLLLLGLALLRVWPRLLSIRAAPVPGPWQPLFRHFLDAPGPGAAFLLGTLTGYLPCPITLALLAAATGAHSSLAGLALLSGLGIGTAPGLLGLGLSGALATARWRPLGTRAAGALLLVLGAVTLLRPTGLLCRVLPVLDALFPPTLG